MKITLKLKEISENAEGLWEMRGVKGGKLSLLVAAFQPIATQGRPHTDRVGELKGAAQ